MTTEMELNAPKRDGYFPIVRPIFSKIQEMTFLFNSASEAMLSQLGYLLSSQVFDLFESFETSCHSVRKMVCNINHHNQV